MSEAKLLIESRWYLQTKIDDFHLRSRGEVLGGNQFGKFKSAYYTNNLWC